ncbi:MAG: hypothetical protein NTV01_18780, partial [Bacteroidia bacterium]|nr:hypothetical protein [Bacteroidia bacterium]
MNWKNRKITILLILFFTILPAYCIDNQEEWVVYSTEIGWLRIGTWSEFKAVWQKKDEIWGGTSTDTLKKRLLLQGFSTWDEAAKILCGKLAKVQLHINTPQGAPSRYLTAIL